MIDISTVLLGNVNEFIDYALWITAGFVVYYVVRVIMGTEVKPEEETADLVGLIKKGLASKKKNEKEAKEEKEKGLASKKKNEKEAKEEKEKEEKTASRRKHLNGVRGFLLRAIEDGSDLLTALNRSNRDMVVKEANTPLRDMRRNISDATHELRRIFRREKDAAKHDFFDSLYRSCGMALKVAERIEMPPVDATNWYDLITREKEEVTNVRKICLVILNRINEFINSEKVEAYNVTAKEREAIEVERAAAATAAARARRRPAPARGGSPRPVPPRRRSPVSPSPSP